MKMLLPLSGAMWTVSEGGKNDGFKEALSENYGVESYAITRYHQLLYHQA